MLTNTTPQGHLLLYHKNQLPPMSKLNRTPNSCCIDWKKINSYDTPKNATRSTMIYGLPRNHASAQRNGASQLNLDSDTSTSNSFNQKSTPLAGELQYTNLKPSNIPKCRICSPIIIEQSPKSGPHQKENCMPPFFP